MSTHKDQQRKTWFFSTRINGKQYTRRGFETKKKAAEAELFFIIEN